MALDPGQNITQVGTATLTQNSLLAVFDPVTGAPGRTTVALVLGLLGGVVATAATTPTGVPANGAVGTALSGLSTTLTPSNATAYASLSQNGVEQSGGRVAFIGTQLPFLIPSAANAATTVNVYAAPTGGSPLATSAAINVAASPATNASALGNVPATGTAGTAISGVTTTLTPAGATAWANILVAGVEQAGGRIQFTGGTLPSLTPTGGSPNTTIGVWNAATGGTLLVQSGAINVAYPTATAASFVSGVPAGGNQNVALNTASTVISITPGNAAVYACLDVGGADEGTRQLVTGTSLPSLTPQSYGAYTIVLYPAQTGGTALATSSSITVAQAPALPGAPSGLTLGTVTATTVALTWTAPTSGGAPTGYNVMRSVHGANTYASVGTPTGTSFTDTAAVSGASYDYEVFATNSTGSSASASNVVNAVIPYPGLTMASPVWDTSSPKFGSGDLVGGTGTGSFTMPANADFTLEFWAKITDQTHTGFLVSWVDSASHFTGIGESPAGKAQALLTGGGTSANQALPTDGAWHHYAAVLSNYQGKTAFYLDGAVIGTNTNNPNAAGNCALTVGSTSLTGWAIDEIRISSNQRYSAQSPASFTPPTGAFTRDANTLALFHLDGNGNGS